MHIVCVSDVVNYMYIHFKFNIIISIVQTHTNFIVFGLTRSGLEPTIYRTRGEHTNHYITDAVL
jgi:hypothetical protein